MTSILKGLLIAASLAVAPVLALTTFGNADAQDNDRVFSAKKALIGGTLVDGLGGAPIYDSVILVDGNQIVDVGEEGKLDIPDGYEIISTEAMTIMPGLWEMHAHLMLNGHSNYAHWDKTYNDRLGNEIMPSSAEQLLLAGVTTARDLGAPLDDSVSVKRRIEEGEIAGPRLFISGPFIQHKAYPGTEAFRWGVNSTADGRAKVRLLAEAGVDVIKLIDQDVMPINHVKAVVDDCLLYTSPSPRDRTRSRMPSSA